MKDKGQATFLLIAIVAFLGIGIYAGIKLFNKQEKKALEAELAREAEELIAKMTVDIQKKDVCTRSLSGHLKNSAIKKILSPLGEEETALYEVGKQIGRFQIDKMEIKEAFEDSEFSTITMLVHISNFADKASLELTGLKSFKQKIELKVDDCNNYFIAGSSMLEAEQRCLSPRPEGIRGKVSEVLIKESATDPSVLLECHTCRFSGRKVISGCID